MDRVLHMPYHSIIPGQSYKVADDLILGLTKILY